MEEARQTGEIRDVYLAGEASFRRVTSLFRVVGFQLGCVMAYGARREPWEAGTCASTQGWCPGVGQGMLEFLCPE